MPCFFALACERRECDVFCEICAIALSVETSSLTQKADHAVTSSGNKLDMHRALSVNLMYRCSVNSSLG